MLQFPQKHVRVHTDNRRRQVAARRMMVIALLRFAPLTLVRKRGHGKVEKPLSPERLGSCCFLFLGSAGNTVVNCKVKATPGDCRVRNEDTAFTAEKGC